MAWVRLDDGFPEHPKILGLSDAAFRLHILALCYAARNLTDGMIPQAWLTGGKGRTVPKATVQLVLSGVWNALESGGFQIHDYLQYQPSRVQITQKRDDAKVRMSLARNSKIVRANNQKSSHDVRSTPSPPIPSQEIQKPPDPTTSTPSDAPSSSSSSPLITSPLAFEKARKTFVFFGSRLRVPHVLHEEFRSKLGGLDPHQRLVDWYEQVNIYAETTGEPIPDVFEWLRPRFKTWASDQVATNELEKFRPKGA